MPLLQGDSIVMQCQRDALFPGSEACDRMVRVSQLHLDALAGWQQMGSTLVL
jgi:hypothetical protein